MPRLVWNAEGERIFEAGVDRGVLYLAGLDGVPWNGLVSVSESPGGGEVTPYYIDGIKYHNQSAAEEFKATLEAFTYPDEFAICDGTASIGNGLFATQQGRKSFGLTYRTRVGNDEESVEHGYKIHLVYGATAQPSSFKYGSLAETIEPENFSWELFTKAPIEPGIKPTAHFVIDSRATPNDLLTKIEDILYGTDETLARMPSVAELLFIFADEELMILDGGELTDEQFAVYDAGELDEPQTSVIDAGDPSLLPHEEEEWTVYDGNSNESSISTIFDGGES